MRLAERSWMIMGLCLLVMRGPLCGQEDAGGLEMRFYRNFFSGSMNHLAQMDEDGEAPYSRVVLPSFQATSPWSTNRTVNLSRLYALVIAGWIVPDQDGEYELSAQCNGKMAFYLAQGFDASTSREIAFSSFEKPEGGPTSKGKPAFDPNLAATESFPLKAGVPYFVKVRFIPGWQDSLAVGWRLKGDTQPPRIISGGNLKLALRHKGG